MRHFDIFPKRCGRDSGSAHRLMHRHLHISGGEGQRANLKAVTSRTMKEL